MRFGAGLRVGVGLERWTRLGVRAGLRLRGRDLGLGAGLKVEMVLGGGVKQLEMAPNRSRFSMEIAELCTGRGSDSSRPR